MKPPKPSLPSRLPRKPRLFGKPRLFVVWTLLILLALLTLTSCAGNTISTHTASPKTDVSPFLTDKTLSCTVTLEMESGVARTEEGEVLAIYAYQLPVMTVLREDGSALTAAKTEAEKQALAAADAFNAEFIEWAESADFPSLEAAAKEDYQWRTLSGQTWDFQYSQSLESSVYQTDRMVSITGNYYSYSGGAHPNTMLFGWNFDLRSGQFFSPEQLFEDVEAVTAELVRLAGERAAEFDLQPEEFFWRDYEDVLALWSDSNVAVTFDAANMTVSYPPYELASYAAGEQIFTVPLAWLKPWLNDYGKELLF